ncbi:hypothetical protein MN608_02677 [Microdochium nivale]|nr:hypothetical protein MN608_02677 [Microdochium nivale]
MRSSQESARRHSLSSEDEFVRPHRGRLDDSLQGPRRIRLPRSKSASNMLQGQVLTLSNTEDDLRDIAREQVDPQALQELAEFLRTTGPRSSSAQYRHDECFRVPANGANAKRWSFQTLKNRRPKTDRPSMPPLTESAKPGTTTKGNHYLAIEVPDPDVVDGPWGRSQYPVYAADSLVQPERPQSPSWPARVSSRGALSPTSPMEPSYPTKSPPSFPKSVDQSSAKSSDLAELNKTLERHLLANTDNDTYDDEQDQDQETGIVSIRPRTTAATVPNLLQESALSLRQSLLPSGGGGPKINTETHDATSRPSVSPGIDIANFRLRSAVTPPCMAHLQAQSFPELRIDSPDESAAFPVRLHKRGLSAFPQTLTSPTESPTSPRRARPSNIAVGASLMVPKETILPDSPGFPTMLAAMTFPSPPRSTGSNSPTSSIYSAGSRPSSPQAVGPPLIRPRNSSLRSKTSQTLSMDEVVMQSSQKTGPAENCRVLLERPEIVRSRTAPQSLTTPVDTKIDEEVEPNHEAQTPAAVSAIKAIDGVELLPRPRTSSSVSTTKPDRCESSGSFYTADESHTSQRNSTSSYTLDFENVHRFPGTMDDPYDLSRPNISYRQSTITDDSYRQSGMTISSNRQSTRSDITAATDLSIASQDKVEKHTEHPVSQEELSTELTPNYGRKPSIADSFDSNNDDNSCLSERSGTPSSLHSSITEDESHPKSILERRLARKTKVREYKQKDLASVRTSLLNPSGDNGAFDSPVLGWFPQNTAKSKRISSSGPSPLARGTVSTASSGATTPTTPTTPTRADRGGKRQATDSQSRNDSRQPPDTAPRVVEPVAAQDWTVSPVMVLESTPVCPEETYNRLSRPDTETSNLSLSPLIIIASVTGQSPQSPKRASPLRPLSLLTFDPAPILPARSALRLKIKPQRPLPIKIARQPVPAIFGYREQRNIRHSMSAVPTPPISPETRSSMRMSVPVQALPTPPASSSAEMSFDRISLQRRREKQMTQHKERQENEWLKAHQKDRELEWRISAMKERLRREKMEKDKESADLAASSNEQPQSTSTGSCAATEGGQYDRSESTNDSNGNTNDKKISTEVEQRLERLEKSGDAYLRIMVPLLENMNRTLTEMRKDGIVGGLTMGLNMHDFVLDMHAQTKAPSSVVDGPSSTTTPAATARNKNVRQSFTYHTRDLSRSSHTSTDSSSSNKMSARVEMNMSRPRSRRNTQISCRIGDPTSKNQSIDSTRRSHETYHTGCSSPLERNISNNSNNNNNNINNSEKPLPSVPLTPPTPPTLQDMLPPPPISKELHLAPPSPMMDSGEAETPRTPGEHQIEAQQAIQRRIQEQEAIFGQLMSGWNVVDSKRGSRPRSSTLPSSKPDGSA